MLEVRRLRLLRELRRLGTISAVAEALSYSPSAISQQLALLQREVGAQLLEPAGRRVRLTPVADLLVDHTEALLEHLERTEAAVADSVRPDVGRLRVAAFQTAVLALVAPAMVALQRQQPGLRVHVTDLEPDVAVPALVSGEFDLVIDEEYPGHPLPPNRGTQRLDITDDELWLAVPSSWSARRLADLAAEPFVMEPTESTARHWAVNVCRAAGFEPDVAHTSPDPQIQLGLVESGLAAAFLPELSGAGDRAGVEVVQLPGRPARRLLASVRRGAAAHPLNQLFVSALRTARAGS